MRSNNLSFTNGMGLAARELIRYEYRRPFGNFPARGGPSREGCFCAPSVRNFSFRSCARFYIPRRQSRAAVHLSDLQSSRRLAERETHLLESRGAFNHAPLTYDTLFVPPPPPSFLSLERNAIVQCFWFTQKKKKKKKKNKRETKLQKYFTTLCRFEDSI